MTSNVDLTVFFLVIQLLQLFQKKLFILEHSPPHLCSNFNINYLNLTEKLYYQKRIFKMGSLKN